MVDPGQHGCPRDPAHVLAVEIGEAYASLGEGIEVRGEDFTPKATEVGVAHVVRHDEQDVGPFAGLDQGAGPGQEKEDEELRFHKRNKDKREDRGKRR